MKLGLTTFEGAKVSCVGVFVADTAIMAAAYYLAFLLRFDFQAPWWGWKLVSFAFLTVFLVQSASLTAFGCYKLVWRYVSVRDVPRFLGAIGLSTAVLLLLRFCLPNGFGIRPPYSVALFNGVLVAVGLLGVRLLWRLLAEGEFSRNMGPLHSQCQRVLLVGAGAAGNLVARELRGQAVKRLDVVGYLDDDAAKQRVRIQGYPVLGRIDDLPETVRRFGVEQVIVAMASAPREVVRRIVRLCERVHVPARIVPGYYELIDGSLSFSKIRDIDVADLLGRPETMSDARSVVELLCEKRVLVTGAGGSIGSELVRQILRAGPEQLILVERSENALYELEREIRACKTSTPFVVQLADAGCQQRMSQVFSQFRPHIVVHAAAYKHVPMMEQNPVEAVDNNVLASRCLGVLSVKHGVERFVFISTDKAVNPISVMGITKRMAEIVLTDLNRLGGTRFSAVRFGNVLDSSGSVVPLFREQIANEEPVTVTHPDMKRYFMTISEAVSLVLQAASSAQGGEVFVLDMGEPVRIIELAEEMISLSGLRPYEDIPITFTGVRPGEKLFEELDVSERSTYKTGHARIFVSKIREAAPESVRRMLASCEMFVSSCGDREVLRERLKQILVKVEEEARAQGAPGEG